MDGLAGIYRCGTFVELVRTEREALRWAASRRCYGRGPPPTWVACCSTPLTFQLACRRCLSNRQRLSTGVIRPCQWVESSSSNAAQRPVELAGHGLASRDTV